jgi:hypothetical protein
MPDQPKTEAEQKAEALKKKFAEATAKMTDYALAERVRAAHSSAANSEEGIDAMVKDYERAAEEAKRPYGEARPASEPR